MEDTSSRPPGDRDDFFTPGTTYELAEARTPAARAAFMCVATAPHPSKPSTRRAFGFLRISPTAAWQSYAMGPDVWAYGWTAVATEPGQPVTVYEAQYDTERLGLYTNRAAARQHCLADVQREAAPPDGFTSWVPDHGDDAPEDLLVFSPGDESGVCTGYSVIPVTASPAYTPQDQEQEQGAAR
ncbi:hypothetical protein [Streptomyces sp. DH37]|uniref:hypothetical protein n=1 Tax=Streptomyces sp. DH37 TaxID=3040122 RepID=UPI00244268BB|nr:hypothetical protein [Streptomyces sp. DH37]MDG9703733.1 hypothetical protein [Streptomyces sp. DH37]